MLGSTNDIIKIFGYYKVSKPYRYARKKGLSPEEYLQREMFQNLIGMLGSKLRIPYFYVPQLFQNLIGMLGSQVLL